MILKGNFIWMPAMDRLEGAYSLVIASPSKLIAARDPHGFRPLCYGQTEDGTTPTFGQLSQGSMQPHTDYMRALAARFSGETNVPVSQLGVIHDNPSSAEAITQANEPLIMEVTDLNEGNGEALVTIAKMALAIANDATLDAYDELQIAANFKNPLMPSIASQADAMVKIASVVPEFAATEVFWEQLGFGEDMRQKVVQQMGANANQRAILSLMGGGTQVVG